MRRGVMLLACGLVLAGTGPALADDAPSDAARLAARRTPVVEVFERCRDAVVNVASTEIVEVRHGGFHPLFDELFDLPNRPRTRQFARQSVGSGFVIHPDGYIVTNAHVVARTAERKAVFADGREFDAEIVALDTDRDVAVLKIESDQSFATLPLGRSADLMVGETVIAIGNPLGYQHTVTAGVVSAVERDLDFPGDRALRGLIQTDASINPGNSGGPLLNVLGELIGVNTAIRGDAQNIGFAIPVDQLREVLPDLIDVNRRYRIETGLAVSSFDGPRVERVDDGSPAAKAGLRPGDVLVAIDDAPVREGLDFHIGLIARRAGEHVRLRVRRGDAERDVVLVLAARPEPDGIALARRLLGIEVEALPQAVARRLGLPRGSGLLVTNVERGGPAGRIGIEPQDVLVALGRHYVGDPDRLGQLLESADPGDELPVTLLRAERRGKVRLDGVLRVR